MELVVSQSRDFAVYHCCTGADSIWVRRMSTEQGADLPSDKIQSVLRLPEEQWDAALARCWNEYAG